MPDCSHDGTVRGYFVLKTMRVTFDGKLPLGVTAKDMISGWPAKLKATPAASSSATRAT